VTALGVQSRSTAIVVNGTAYLVDFGAGVMRRAQGAYEKGVAALNPREIHVAFLTHLHQEDAARCGWARQWRRF
jgi:hypothetical protein